jgi:hypothetical protein
VCCKPVASGRCEQAPFTEYWLSLLLDAIFEMWCLYVASLTYNFPSSCLSLPSSLDLHQALGLEWYFMACSALVFNMLYS